MDPQANPPSSVPGVPSAGLPPSMPPVSPSGGMGFAPAPAATPPPPPSSPLPMTNTIATPPRRGFPKKIIFIVVLLLVIGGGLALALKFLGGGGTATQEANLTWWGLWEDDQAIAPIIAQYQQSHPGVTIKYERQSPQDYRERLINSLSQGRGPDIFRIHNSWTPMFKDFIAPLPSSIMSSAEYQQTFYPVSTSDFTDLSTGSLLAIPLEIDTLGLYINEEIFETYLKTPPTTWDQFLELAVEMTIKDQGGIIRQSGAAMGRTENIDHWPEILALIMMQNNVKMTNPTGIQAEQVLDYYTRFSRRYGVWDATLPSSTEAFAAGKVAMYFGPSWRVHEIREMNPALRFKVVPAPQLPKATPTDPDVYYATYWAESVWSESPSTEAAWEFLKFMSTAEPLQQFYQAAAAASAREFGEPYSRIDMQQLLVGSPYVGPFVQQATLAKSWYLAAHTFDGPTGINSQINKYFQDAVNSVNNGTSPESALKTVATGITSVLSKYGISTGQQPQK